MKRYSIVLLGLLAGCTQKVESDDIRTSGIYPEFDVVADGSGSSDVSARLKVGGNSSNTFLELHGADTLEVTADGDSKELSESSSRSYGTSFNVDDGGTEFIFAFLRGDEDEDAPMSVVTLPEPFELTVETAEAVRTMDDVTISWDGADTGDVTVSIDGDCIFPYSATTPDDGAHVIAADRIDEHQSDADEECTVMVSVQRVNDNKDGTAELDPEFTEGGEIKARQVRSGTFRSLPASE